MWCSGRLERPTQEDATGQSGQYTAFGSRCIFGPYEFAPTPYTKEKENGMDLCLG